jgi:hypothetical protein
MAPETGLSAPIPHPAHGGPPVFPLLSLAPKWAFTPPAAYFLSPKVNDVAPAKTSNSHFRKKARSTKKMSKLLSVNMA